MATAKRSSPNAKRSTANGRKSTAQRSRTTSSQAAGSSKTTKRGQSTKPASASRAPKKAAANGAKRRTAGSGASGSSAASRNGSTRARGSANRRTTGSQNGSARRPNARDGVVESLKHAGASALRTANRASGPTVTVAAAAAGIAGGLILRQRPKAAIRDGLGARSRDLLHDIDPSAVVAGLGRASMLVSQRSKSLARDIDQVADRAERLSKVLR
jgi:hypothetical protein